MDAVAQAKTVIAVISGGTERNTASGCRIARRLARVELHKEHGISDALPDRPGALADVVVPAPLGLCDSEDPGPAAVAPAGGVAAAGIEAPAVGGISGGLCAVPHASGG